MVKNKKGPFGKTLFVVLVNVVIAIVVFCLIEGFFSSISVVKKAFFEDLDTLAERRHTRYDEEIGWVNLPNLTIDDMYDNKLFVTNSMAFRNSEEFSVEVPDNRVRVICSGDSFTLGYGVSNDEAWCSRLGVINSRIQDVNLGQGGYGVDQAYLWYMRNSDKLEHDIQIFAFITRDFYRMQWMKFQGVGKPYLVLQDGMLVNTNVPIPKRSPLRHRWERVQSVFQQLDTVRILKGRLFPYDHEQEKINKKQMDVQTREVVKQIIEELKEKNEAKNSKLVLLHLPMRSDFLSDESNEWLEFMRVSARESGILFIDLFDEFREYPPQEMRSLFNPDSHYSPKGNRFIADALYKKMHSSFDILVEFDTGFSGVSGHTP